MAPKAQQIARVLADMNVDGVFRAIGDPHFVNDTASNAARPIPFKYIRKDQVQQHLLEPPSNEELEEASRKTGIPIRMLASSLVVVLPESKMSKDYLTFASTNDSDPALEIGAVMVKNFGVWLQEFGPPGLSQLCNTVASTGAPPASLVQRVFHKV